MKIDTEELRRLIERWKERDIERRAEKFSRSGVPPLADVEQAAALSLDTCEKFTSTVDEIEKHAGIVLSFVSRERRNAGERHQVRVLNGNGGPVVEVRCSGKLAADLDLSRLALNNVGEHQCSRCNAVLHIRFDAYCREFSVEAHKSVPVPGSGLGARKWE